MMPKVSAVVQGKFVEESFDVIANIRESGVFDEVIFSGWEYCSTPVNLDSIKSRKPDNCGIGNRNLQIVSSLEGAKACSGEICVKFRSDQIISVDSLRLMSDFYKECGDGAVCVAGIFKTFPFHPRDHIFWGRREELIQIFDIPLDSNPHVSNPDYNKNTRAETYIGAHYASKFNKRVLEFLESPELFLSDVAPRRAEAMNISDELTQRVFKPFPRIKFAWPKHGMSRYHYHVTEAMGEYWNEDTKWKR
jgi:hypothetical protein